jgi:hypothetical protein
MGKTVLILTTIIICFAAFLVVNAMTQSWSHSKQIVDEYVNNLIRCFCATGVILGYVIKEMINMFKEFHLNLIEECLNTTKQNMECGFGGSIISSLLRSYLKMIKKYVV